MGKCLVTFLDVITQRDLEGESKPQSLNLCKHFKIEKRKGLNVFVGEWNSTFFAFSLIIECATEKVLQLIMPLKSIYNQNLGFIEQKLYFEYYREAQTMNNLLIDIIFAMKIFFW
jgi:hypothetical protein